MAKRSSKHLVIVESPSKAQTIAKYLGKDYVVKASVGHVRDLPTKGLGVDIEQGFRPTYQVSRGKAEVIAEIRQAAEQAAYVYLATDLDREGEAIAWHVAEAAGLHGERVLRITFDQVTKSAILDALAHPRTLNYQLIDAQQARRVLDRLVGYEISPLLSKTMKRRLSAGRVQSVALRLVVDREREILAFVPEEYWTLDAELQRRAGDKERFTARLHRVKGNKPELHTRADVDAVLAALDGATYTVRKVDLGKRRRSPQPPFITSTLQADAGRRLRLSPRQTMRLAQQLYEGIDLDGERVGLITYMRTDSPHVAPEAQAEARDYIAREWGNEYLPSKPPSYSPRSKRAQEAHEAIRPTSVMRTPDAMRPFLDKDQHRLYELIWRRFLASQMAPALYDTMTVDIEAATAASRGEYWFRATGLRLVFPGYLKVYEESAPEGQEEESRALPPLAEGEALDLRKLVPEQHFTQPPPRYSEATLIQALEANGVGRPSTYASIISVIQDRGYVVKEAGRLAPTPLGMLVCDVLLATFQDIMDVGYTAEMEERLDRVATGELGYAEMLGGFYQGFRPEVVAAKEAMPQVVAEVLTKDVPPEVRDRVCPHCGSPLEVRISAQGRFLGCTGYPECRYVLDLSNPERPGEPAAAEFAEGQVCDKCGGRMKIIQRGRSRFLGCEHYPTCKSTRPILSDKIKELALTTACPECKQQPLEPRSGRYGEYLRCPACNKNISLRSLKGGGAGAAAAVVTVDLPCPHCGARPVERREGRYGPYYRCPSCRKNTSEKKMAAGGGGGDAP